MNPYKIVGVIVMGLIFVAAIDFGFGIEIRPKWKQLIHQLAYMLWGAAIAMAILSN